MKKKHEPASLLNEGEEENYFVSLSDLMTGVLFVFVILTTALALDYHTKSGELEKAKQGVIEARGKAEEVQEALDALAKVLREREQLRKNELQKLVSRLREQKLAVELDETNGILRLPGRLLFDASKAQLQPEGEKALSLLAKEMLPVVQKGCGGSPLKWEAIYIEGHTDNIPIHEDFPSNWHLSSARAISTFTALLVAEPALAKQLNHQQKAVIGISGYGDQRPVADNSTDEGRQKNRRIDIRFVMAYPSRAEIEDMERKLKEASKKMESAKP
jgi:flagellar motor protein MotB